MKPLANRTFRRVPASIAYVTRLARAVFSDFVYLQIEPFTVAYGLSVVTEALIAVVSTLELHRAAYVRVRNYFRPPPAPSASASRIELKQNPMHGEAQPAASAQVEVDDNVASLRVALKAAQQQQMLLRRSDMVLFRDIVSVTAVYAFILGEVCVRSLLKDGGGQFSLHFRSDDAQLLGGFTITVVVMSLVRGAMFWLLRSRSIAARARLVEVADTVLEASPSAGSTSSLHQDLALEKPSLHSVGAEDSTPDVEAPRTRRSECISISSATAGELQLHHEVREMLEDDWDVDRVLAKFWQESATFVVCTTVLVVGVVSHWVADARKFA